MSDWIYMLVPGLGAGVGAWWGTRIRRRRIAQERLAKGQEPSEKDGLSARELLFYWVAAVPLIGWLAFQGAPWWIFFLIVAPAAVVTARELSRRRAERSA